jgi:ribonuclease HII
MAKTTGKLITAPTNIEDSFMSRGISPVAGVDEAGRGALAGAVVACAVILPKGLVIEGVNDSKKLNEKTRAELSRRIKETAICYAFGIVDVNTITEINILQASLLAMKKAVIGLTVTPAVALIDGNKLPQGLPCQAFCVTQGDSASHIIAAASILAKVHRDEMMMELHDMYPLYGFNKHKGYGTAAHKAALQLHGLCPQHRESFCH